MKFLILLLLSLSLCLSLVSSQNVCCQATTAECRACASNMTVQEFCLSCLRSGNNDVGCLDCASKNLTSVCRIRAYSPTKAGRYVPSCEVDGSFSPMQCHGSIGMCWCVTDDGTEIPGTRNRPTRPRPICSAHPVLTSCQAEAIEASRSGAIGAFIPRCRSDGSYSPMQCHSSPGSCWCVSEDGTEVTGTRNRPGQPLPVCNDRPELSSCQRSALDASSANLVGSYIPQCEVNGDYSPLQCHGSTGYCWCVDESGAEIDGTRQPPGNAPTTCRLGKTPCEFAAWASRLSQVVGGFVPQCGTNGEYLPQQCHGSTGMCWCVNSVGVEIPGTRNRPGQPLTQCTFTELTQCQEEALRATNLHVVGNYIPQCQPNGAYSSTQCHASTGTCWCVDTNGSEIPNTLIVHERPRCPSS
eukprot:c19816_g1_i1.p1 GENE.c19816_g1_i1~~c19816_g1_i1.p1  ORF type:complete len:424 (-),score=175.84 c19816_g1_i1:43-1278(-)